MAKTQRRVDEKLLREVWSNQPGKYACVAKKHNGVWSDQAFPDIDEAISWLKEQPLSADVYWCPTLFTKPKRRKENVPGSAYLWADLDFADPRKIAKEIEPTIAWESSPGRYQALWRLTDVVDPSETERLNKDLSYYIGADKGGWDLTQVLRIPGATNNKYQPAPVSKLLWSDRAHHKYDSVASYVGSGASNVPSGLSEYGEGLEFDEIILKHRKKLPRKLLSLLLQRDAPTGNRSSVLWYLEHELVKSGLTAQEIFVLIKNSAWNKFAGRSDEDKRLMHEITQAVEHELIDKLDEDEAPARVERDSKKRTNQRDLEREGDDNDGLSLIVESDDALMSNLSSSPGWLVEGFWTRRSHGIVAGEPKSFKSTILLDFMVSVASGAPFLGKFEVLESGPVLYIQNENASWILKDRLEKIRGHKSLIGEAEVKNGMLKMTPPPRLPIHYINQQGFNLNDPIHQQLLEQLLQEIKPILLVLDPLYLMFDGDINSAKDLSPVLQWLLGLKFRYNMGVILVHHWNKGGASSRGGQRMLGSTTLHGWTESAWYLKTGSSPQEADDGDATKSSDSVNVANEGAKVTIEREFRGAGMYPKVDLLLKMGDFGDFTYSTEVEKHKPGQQGGHNKVDRSQATTDILAVLANSSESLSEFQIAEETGISRRVVKEAVEILLEQGKVERSGNEKRQRIKFLSY